MIRVLVLSLGLLLGLCGAALVGGRMAHLRMMTDHLPAWSGGIDGSAGVLAGQGRIADAALRWHLAGVDGRGPRWQVTLGGTDWQVRGAARLAAGGVRVEGLDGVIPASLLMADATGILALTGGALRIALPAGTLTEAELNATARDLVLAGEGEPDGSFVLRLVDGFWAAAPDDQP